MSNVTVSKANVRNVRKLVTLGMISALSFVVLMISKQIPLAAPGAPFLNFDMKDSIIAIGAFIYGPMAGAAISLVISFIEMITISGTGLYGFVMNVTSTCMLILPAAIIYKRYRTITGAVVGLAVGVLSMTAIMLLWNYVITPFYMGYPRDAVAAMLLPVFLPYNLIKGALNATMAMVLYKPLRAAIRKTRLLEIDSVETAKSSFKWGAFLISVAALITVVMLLLVFTGVL